jgi:hypothetical protein
LLERGGYLRMVEYKYDKNKLIINQKQYGKLSTG